MSKKNKTGVGEWADKSFNFQDGCANGCKYCYARKIKNHFEPHIDFENPIFHPTKEALKMLENKTTSRVMFPTMHDIDENNLPFAKSSLKTLLEHGTPVLVVTKGGPASYDLCEFAKWHVDDELLKNLEFRITIGSMEQDTLSYWEPNAPKFAERIKLIKAVWHNRIKVSISCEPMLDDTVYGLIEYLPYLTGGIWYGFMNNHPEKPELSEPLTKLLQLKEQYGDAIHFKDSVVKALEKQYETC